ncbi:hypothetical protein GCM10008090_24600 [Arenicella chitinivorans]|uniref:Uncharacterized protein n=1 Tax=Arenicella chitinivorans TaxID=1329800 RepID=A0A918VQ07_9GAMM|nr:hypothetical protein [Arenicella chitinivorans]GHA13904.1 hypothetical protein GCM10008090_24600 [Arenicella chitinivorans]
MRKYLTVLAMTLFLSGCAEPLPEERRDYVGQWQGTGMELLILKDGTVAYERIKGGGSTSVNAPLKEFVGDDFTVGILFMTTTFDVSSPPHEVDGVWKMTVDGVELTRVSE